MSEQHQNQLIENLAKHLWNIRWHDMLKSAGHPTEWEKQTKLVKREYWREARKIYAFMHTHSLLNTKAREGLEK